MAVTLYSLGAAEEVTGSKHMFEIRGWMVRGFLYISQLKCVEFDSVGNLGH